jgi:AhpD family alkylhydroperoxidase
MTLAPDRGGAATGPRVRPGTAREIGPLGVLVSRLAGRRMGTDPPHVFTTLGRNRRLFWRWLLFAGGLMPGGRLPRVDTELVILRVSVECDCPYEWDHHERLGRAVGLTDADLARVREGPDAPGWGERRAALLRATDELIGDRRIGEATWSALERELPVPQRIELCMLVGHYAMLAGTLNSLGVERDVRRARK